MGYGHNVSSCHPLNLTLFDFLSSEGSIHEITIFQSFFSPLDLLSPENLLS